MEKKGEEVISDVLAKSNTPYCSLVLTSAYPWFLHFEFVITLTFVSCRILDVLPPYEVVPHPKK